jgi:hypothetical protein
MAVAIANTTKSGGAPSNGAYSISVARASGEGLLVGVHYEFNGGSTADTITSVVWDSAGDNQSFTHVLTQQQTYAVDDVHPRWLAVYVLAAPTSAKTGNITVTFSGSNNNSAAVIVRHITGHDTAAMISNSAKRFEADMPANDLPITVNSATGELVVAFAAARNEVGYFSAGDTSDYSEQAAFDSSRSIISGSKAGASSVTATFDYAEVTHYDNALVAVSITPADASATITLTPDPASVQVGGTRTFTATRSAPAGAGGVTYNLTSSDTGKATVPATATILEGNSSITFNATGVAAGSTTITATNAADSGETDSVTLTVTALTKKLKLLAHADAQGDSGVAGAVWSAPAGSNITGPTKYGEFTGATFEAALEGGKAVLKVPVADFGGSALTTSDTPVALVRNATNTTGIISCTVIEE